LKKFKKPLLLLAVAAFWLAVWEVIALNAPTLLPIPTPWQVWLALAGLAKAPEFWKSCGYSLLRVAGGFLAAVVAGTVLAGLTVRFRAAHILLSPLLLIVRSTPVASFIILCFMYFTSNTLPVFIAFLMVMPLVWGNVEKGIRGTDRTLLEMAAVFRMGAFRTFRHVRVPAVMPYFLSACTTGLGFAWKASVAAEVISPPGHALGTLLLTAKRNIDLPQVFASTVAVIVLSLLLEQLLLRLVRRAGREAQV